MAILEGVRVLDLGHVLAGPYAAQLLADAGAQVIRIERPGGDNDRRLGNLTPTGDSYGYIERARNKQAITLNLSTQKGREILWQLVKISDVLIEGFAPPRIKETLGVDYATLSAKNPGIVVISITCFGLSGPYANRLGIDPVAQALSGAMSITGFPGNPPVRSSVPWVDALVGAQAAFSAVLALYERKQSGKGDFIDLALLDTAASTVAMMGVFNEYRLKGIERPQYGNVTAYSYADAFEAKDGWVFLAFVRDSVWRRTARAIGREDLIEDPRFSSDMARFEHRDELREIMKQIITGKTVDEVVNLLGEGAMCARINRVSEVSSHPQVKARQTLLEMDFPQVPGGMFVHGLPIKFARNPGEIKRRAPLLGEHNEEVYCGLLGYSSQEFAGLKEQSII